MIAFIALSIVFFTVLFGFLFICYIGFVLLWNILDSIFSSSGGGSNENIQDFQSTENYGQYSSFDNYDYSGFSNLDITDTARIDSGSDVVQQKGWFGDSDTGIRVDPETGVIQERGGFFGWNDTGERIDPETGNLQERGFFGWRDK